MGTRRTGNLVYFKKNRACSSCGRPLPAENMECAHCSNGKDATDKVTEVVRTEDPKIIKRADDGAFWECKRCKYFNERKLTHCKRCGCPEVEPTNPEQEHPEATPPPLPPPERQQRPPPPPREERHVAAPQTNALAAMLPIVGVVFAGAATIAFLCWLLIPREVTAPVARISWEYEVQLQREVPVHDEGWDPPSDAYNLQCAERQRGTKECNAHDCEHAKVDCNAHECEPCTKSVDTDHCEDEGNDIIVCPELITCETCYDKCAPHDVDYEECPVFDDWCAYDHDVWTDDRRDSTYGTTHDVHWPALKANGPKQRLQKSESYSVYFVIEGEELKFKPQSLQDFRSYSPGDTCTVNVNRVGIVGKPICTRS